MHPAKLRYRAHIDGLRAVAVLLVIGFHTFPKAVRAGFVGVDIFFVISGYLISSILYAEFGAAQASGGGVIRDFYSRRVRRIFPSLIVALVACYVRAISCSFRASSRNCRFKWWPAPVSA